MMGSMTNSSYSDDDNNNTFDLSMQKIRDNSNSNDNNYGLDTTRALLHPHNKPKPVRKVHFNNVREVHFNNIMIINEIPSHRALTSHERLSLWYTKVDYKFFQIEERKKNKRNRFAASIENNENENNNNNNNSRNNKGKTHNTLSSSSNSRSSNNPNPNKLSKSCQQRRIHEIRCMVLIRAQYAYQNFNLQRFDEKNVSTTTTTSSSSSSNSNSNNNSNHNNIIVDGYARDSYYFQQQQRRLAEFYRQHSWPCLQAARERALENEIWNINRKLQEHFQYYQKQMVSHTQAASSCFQHWF
jgi:hypothetical protein